MTTVPPGRTSATASDHACSVPAASITTSAPRPSPTSAPNSSASARRSSRPPTITGQPPASATHAASISPIGPAPRIATVSPAVMPARSMPRRQHASGSTIAATSGATPARHVVQVHRRDSLGHDEPLGVRAGEKHELAALLAARAAVARAARRGVRGDDAAPVDEPAELVAEARGRLREQQRMAAPVRLQVGAVGERDLDLDEHVARPRLGTRHLLDPQVAGRVEQRRLHGVKTTLSASPRR